jgi:hypothetical protein
VLPKFAVVALAAHRTATLKEGHTGGPVFCTTAGTYLVKSNFVRRPYRPLVGRAIKLADDAVAAHGTGTPAGLPDEHAAGEPGEGVEVLGGRRGAGGGDVLAQVRRHPAAGPSPGPDHHVRPAVPV